MPTRAAATAAGREMRPPLRAGPEGARHAQRTCYQSVRAAGRRCAGIRTGGRIPRSRCSGTGDPGGSQHEPAGVTPCAFPAGGPAGRTVRTGVGSAVRPEVGCNRGVGRWDLPRVDHGEFGTEPGQGRRAVEYRGPQDTEPVLPGSVVRDEGKPSVAVVGAAELHTEPHGEARPKRTAAGSPAFLGEPDPSCGPAARSAACVGTGADRIGVASASESALVGVAIRLAASSRHRPAG